MINFLLFYYLEICFLNKLELFRNICHTFKYSTKIRLCFLTEVGDTVFFVSAEGNEWMLLKWTIFYFRLKRAWGCSWCFTVATNSSTFPPFKPMLLMSLDFNWTLNGYCVHPNYHYYMLALNNVCLYKYLSTNFWGMKL